jgi:cysteine desulfurase
MIYLDHNATTPLSAIAREAMRPFLEEHFGNPSSVHAAGREARAAIDDARDRLAALLRVRPNEIIFTSGGTEANNLAILGLARRFSPNGKHLISNRAEHHAVLQTLEHLENKEGFEVTWLDLSPDGLVDPDQLAKAIRPDTILVSIMSANNETGVIQPMAEIAQRCRKRGVLLHSDMVQSFGKVTLEGLVSARADGSSGNGNQSFPSLAEVCDAASFAAHKFYGPKGAGFLYLRGGIPIDSIQFGGAHENQRRPGTENVAAIVGMAAAAEEILRDLPNEQAREGKLRDDLWGGIARISPGAQANAADAPRLANTLNVSFPGLTSEMMLIALDLEGVCASSGSACMVGSVVASHVLLALGLSSERAGSAIRFSLGKGTIASEIEATIAAISRIVRRQNPDPTRIGLSSAGLLDSPREVELDRSLRRAIVNRAP